MYKTKLQELCHRLELPLPEYTVSRKGPDHNAKFQAIVTVNGVSFHSTPDKCKTIKEAENLAAHYAFEFLSQNQPPKAYYTEPSPAPSTLDPALTELHSHPPADPVVLQKVTSSHQDPQMVGSYQTHDPSDPLAGPQPVLPPSHLLQQTLMEDPSYPSKASAGVYKAKLLELCRKHRWKQPEYVTSKEGPDHMPRFTATVVVNEVAYITPHNQCRSSKEATNLAAWVAFNQLASLGFSSADHIDIKVHQDNERSAQPSDIKSTSLASREPSNSSDMQHVYKNQLQQYAQKKGIALPEYSCETEGPPHDRRFRSRVTFDGKSYECRQFFNTLKEAEQAAAKVAVEAVCPDEIQKGGGLSKTLLQQLAHKLGFLFPTYKTVQYGPPHGATFISFVQIGEESYEGQSAKTKKQAEMNAAEIAYNTLINCADVISSMVKKTSATPHPLSLSDQCFVPTPPERSVVSVLPFNQNRSSTMESNVKQTDEFFVSQSKSNSSYATVSGHAPVLPCNVQDLHDSSSSSPLTVQHLSSFIEKFSSIDRATSASNMVLVYPRGSQAVLPARASMLSCSDDKWVAVQVDLNGN